MRYLVQPWDQMFVKSYGFLFYAKHMGKTIGKIISKTFSGRYSQNFLDFSKQSAADALKISSKREIQKMAKITGDLIGNKIAIKITRISKTSQQNSSKTATNKHDNEITKERYICPDERKTIIDDLRLIL